jgi:hypothetical protein
MEITVDDGKVVECIDGPVCHRWASKYQAAGESFAEAIGRELKEGGCMGVGGDEKVSFDGAGRRKTSINAAESWDLPLPREGTPSAEGTREWRCHQQ